jgi:hypothetical protein
MAWLPRLLALQLQVFVRGRPYVARIVPSSLVINAVVAPRPTIRWPIAGRLSERAVRNGGHHSDEDNRRIARHGWDAWKMRLGRYRLTGLGAALCIACARVAPRSRRQFRDVLDRFHYGPNRTSEPGWLGATGAPGWRADRLRERPAWALVDSGHSRRVRPLHPGRQSRCGESVDEGSGGRKAATRRNPAATRSDDRKRGDRGSDR